MCAMQVANCNRSLISSLIICSPLLIMHLINQIFIHHLLLINCSQGSKIDVLWVNGRMKHTICIHMAKGIAAASTITYSLLHSLLDWSCGWMQTPCYNN